VVPPLYVWRIRSRVYKWYGQLRKVEQELETAHGDAREETCRGLLQRLDEIEELVNQISIPLAFADGLYGLRSHINFVRQRVEAALPASPAAEPRGHASVPTLP
ncbi:MAG TPA: C4-dicarboxylate ABC transporter substrate-binding protein, partial [Telluria sp.]|nr:C4-dicarboxylate ABC transporter substrate-binding protein [Telluria sp.]